MTDLFAALALAIVLEGLLYAAFPEQMKKYLAQVLEQPPQRIRIVALVLAGIGLLLLWMIKG